MKIVKNIFRYIISIILSILIITLITINLASSTILSQSYILSQLEDTNYYSKIYEEVNSNFENYIYQSGLEEEVFDNIITVEEIKKDTNTVISNIYSGLTEEISVKEIKKQMNENIENSIRKLYNRELTATEEKSVEMLIDKLTKEYTDTILHFGKDKQINNIYSKIVKYIGIAQKVLYVLVGICVLILVILSLKRIYKIFTMLGVALLSSGIFFATVKAIITLKINIGAITIYNNAISEVIRQVFSNIVSSISNCGNIMLILSFILIIASNLVHNINKSKYEDEN